MASRGKNAAAPKTPDQSRSLESDVGVVEDDHTRQGLSWRSLSFLLKVRQWQRDGNWSPARHV